jgi:hypothetical protein
VGEPYLALNAAQPAPRAVLANMAANVVANVAANVAQLFAQILHAFEAARRLLLEILKIGERGKEGCRATRDLMYEVLFDCVGVMRELLEEGKSVC